MAVKTTRGSKSPRRREPATPAGSRSDAKIDRLERAVFRAKERLLKARRAAPELEVPDYEFKRPIGRSLRLSDAFGTKSLSQ